MNDKQRKRLKRFGDKLAQDSDVMAHALTVWYANGDVENNWSGINTDKPIAPAPFLLTDDDDDNAHS